MRKPMQGGFDQMFRFRARNEHVGRDAKREAIELLLFEDVLDGFVPCASFEPLLVKGLLFVCKFGVRMSQQKRTVMAGNVAQQKFRIAARSGQVLQTFSAMRERRGKGQR